MLGCANCSMADNFSIYDFGLLIGFVVSVFVLYVGRGIFERILRFFAEIISEKPDDDIPPIGGATAERIWKKIFWLAYPEAKLMTLALLNALLSAVCSFSHPVYMGRAIDIVLEAVKGDRASIADAAARMKEIFIVISILEVLKFISAYGSERLNNNVGDFVRQRAQVYLSRHSKEF